jgi:putative transposase
MSVFKKYEVQFFTATILEWKKLLTPDKYKDILIDSFRFLVREQRVSIHAFVIMSNHIHLVWQMKHPHLREHVQRDLLKYTAQKIKLNVQDYHPKVLEHFKVNAKDRQYQFWKKNPLTVDIHTEAVLWQKVVYIHENPVRAGLVKYASDYYYSSAHFYETGQDVFGFLVSPTTAKSCLFIKIV